MCGASSRKGLIRTTVWIRGKSIQAGIFISRGRRMARNSSLAKSNETWLWYAFNGDPLDLDASAYPAIKRIDGTYTVPPWVCVKPDQGFHLREKFERIDVRLSERPLARHDFSAAETSVALARLQWLNLFVDHIDSSRFVLGNVLVDGQLLNDWKTIRTALHPLVHSQEERSIGACPVCGREYFILLSEDFSFDERDEADDKLFVTHRGIFLRQDVAEKCAVPVPRGAFRPPSRLRFKRP